MNRCARHHVGGDAERADVITDLNLQLEQYDLHYGHLDQTAQESVRHRTHDRRQVKQNQYVARQNFKRQNIA